MVLSSAVNAAPPKKGDPPYDQAIAIYREMRKIFDSTGASIRNAQPEAIFARTLEINALVEKAEKFFGGNVFEKYCRCGASANLLRETWTRIKKINTNDQSNKPSLHDALYLLMSASDFGDNMRICRNLIDALDTTTRSSPGKIIDATRGAPK
jgi:hypothetical protein